jgi:hypothetical protein
MILHTLPQARGVPCQRRPFPRVPAAPKPFTMRGIAGILKDNIIFLREVNP